MKKICKIIFLFLLTSVPCPLTSFSQTAPGIEWQNTIGGNKSEVLKCVQQTSDGGYILGGWSDSGISGDKTENCMGLSDYWILKLDAFGNIQWQKTFGGFDFDNLASLQQTSDGGYILAGSFEPYNGVGDYWIIKTNNLGNIEWQKTIGGNYRDLLTSIQKTADGGYILGGCSDSNISGDKTENSLGSMDYWIIKTDQFCNIQWQNTIGGSGFDYCMDVQQTSDGGYIVGGFSDSNISGDKTENCSGTDDYWIVKINNAGIIQWENTIGGNGNDFMRSVIQTKDGGYILGGSSDSNISGDKTEDNNGGHDYWIVKLDSSGNIQWQKTIGGSKYELFTSLGHTIDEGYILGGTIFTPGPNAQSTNESGNCLIVKTDSACNTQWQLTIGGSLEDDLNSIQQTSDNGFIFGGRSFSNISGDKTENNMGQAGTCDYWVIKLTSDTVKTLIPQEWEFILAPNPLVTESKLIFSNPNYEQFYFALWDIIGRITETVSTSNHEIIINKGSKQPGVYLFNLVNEKTGDGWNGKIVISD